MVERVVPACPLAVHLRVKDTAVESDGFGERRTLGTEPSEIGWMIGVALDADFACVVDFGNDATADTAIGGRWFLFQWT